MFNPLIAFLCIGTFDQPRLVILKPILSSPDLASRAELPSPLDSAAQVIPKLAEETKYKLHWKLDIVDYADSVSAEQIAMPKATLTSLPHLAQLHQIATKTGANYVAYYTVSEYIGTRVMSFPTGRVTGKTNLSLKIYDQASGKIVWSSEIADASSREPYNGPMAPRMEQSMFNALRKALEPFVQEGKRKVVSLSDSVYLATVNQIVGKGKRLLLNVSGVQGDYLTDLDGKVRIRIVEALANGAIAEVIKGKPSVGQVFKSEE